MSEWISVEDRLPNREPLRFEHVLVTNGDKVWSCWYNTRVEEFVVDFQIITGVTYWMPLPEPPREDK